MKTQQSFLRIVLRVLSFGLGLLSVLGGIAAFQRSSEPERYLVSAIIMIASGILWLLSSLFQNFRLSQKQYNILLVTLFLGLVFGLLDTFLGCGGECGGASICIWHLGYPGRWLRIANCMAGSSRAPWLWIIKGSWSIDFPSLAADILFWSGVGLIVSFIGNILKAKTIIAASKP